MRFALLILSLTSCLLFSDGELVSSAHAAQVTKAPVATSNAVVATSKATLAASPQYFKVLSVTLWGNQKTTSVGANGFIYQVLNTTAVKIDGKVKTIGLGDAIAVPPGKTAELTAGADVSAFIVFLMVPAADLEKTIIAAPAIVTELYRNPAPITGLNPGRYDFKLTRETLPPETPAKASFSLSGPALYFVNDGAAIQTADGKNTKFVRGEFAYYATGRTYEWANPGSEPMTYVVLNVSPEGAPPILPGAPKK